MGTLASMEKKTTTKPSVKMVVRIVVVALVMGAWLYLWRDDAHGAVVTNSSAVAAKGDVTKHCHIPWAIANGGYNIVDYCKKQNKSNGKMDPKLKFIYKCGGAAVIATWFVRSGKAAAGLGALAACTWGSLYEGHPAKKKAAVRHALAVRSRGCPNPNGLRAV